MEPLTIEHFKRAATDSSFRRFLMETYHLSENDLPPLQQAGDTTVPTTAPASSGKDGYGMLADLGHKVAVGVQGAVKGAGDLMSMLAPGNTTPMGFRQNQEAVGALTDRFASPLPAPETSGEHVINAAARGAASTGGLGGPVGILSGASAGASSDIARQAGVGPGGQILAGIAGGLLPTGVARLASGMSTASKASRIIRRAQEADDQAALVPSPPGSRVQRNLALRVAGQGGEPATRLGENAQSILTDYTTRRQAATDAAREAIARARDEGSRTERAMTDAIRQTRLRGQDEVARLREVERLTRIARQQQGEQAVSEALAGATGDQMANALSRTAGVPKETVRQMVTAAEDQLTKVGKATFGAMDNAELVPGPEGQAVFEVLNDPNVGGLVREAYNTYAPRVEHNPQFQSLQKAYQLLGAKARAAARNGGALPNGDLMTDLYAARDALGSAMEQAFPAFREANAAYRRQALVVDALNEGPLLAGKGKAADIADRMQALAQESPEAADALRRSMARARVDQLRETPVTRDMATRMAAGGSDEIERLRMLFPDEASFQAFADEVTGRMGKVSEAHATGQAGVQAVAPEFAARRMGVRGELRNEVDRLAKDVRTQRDLTQQTVRGLQQRGRESLRALQSEDVGTAKEVAAASRRLDVAEGGRPLKGAVELGAGARARGVVDLIYGLFGKRSDPLDVRTLLADYLLADPARQAQIASELNAARSAQRQMLPFGAARGAFVGSTAGDRP